MSERPSNISNRSKSDNNNNKFKLSGVVVLTVMIVCVVIFAAKGIFKSNGSDIPADVYTGTISTSHTTTTVKATEAADASAKKDDKKSTDSAAESEGDTDSDAESKSGDSNVESKPDESDESDESVAADGEKAYITEYANLHTEPSKDSESIVCMSPNIEVTVLEKLDNDYWKVYFVNVDGPKTGYVWSGYLRTE